MKVDRCRRFEVTKKWVEGEDADLGKSDQRNLKRYRMTAQHDKEVCDHADCAKYVQAYSIVQYEL